MPLKIPAGVKPFKSNPLNTIRFVATLTERLIGGEDGLSAKVKASMARAGADFAESEYVIAALRGGGTAKGSINPEHLYRLVDAKKGPSLTVDEFLKCVAVRLEPLEEFLAGNVIDELRGELPTPAQPKLITEWKPGVVFDVDGAAVSLVDVLKRNVKVCAA
jgi:hypothetical protein